MRQLLRFGIIGLVAMTLHGSVVLLLVPYGLKPLVANVFGFLAAVQLSYYGHRHWSFSATHVPHRIGMVKFIGVAMLGFAINESLYAWLLQDTSWSYETALPVALVTTAGGTFVLSRFWVFR